MKTSTRKTKNSKPLVIKTFPSSEELGARLKSAAFWRTGSIYGVAMDIPGMSRSTVDRIANNVGNTYPEVENVVRAIQFINIDDEYWQIGKLSALDGIVDAVKKDKTLNTLQKAEIIRFMILMVTLFQDKRVIAAMKTKGK